MKIDYKHGQATTATTVELDFAEIQALIIKRKQIAKIVEDTAALVMEGKDSDMLNRAVCELVDTGVLYDKIIDGTKSIEDASDDMFTPDEPKVVGRVTL